LFLDESKTPAVNISTENNNEGDEHRVFYTFKNGFNTTMEVNGKSTTDPLRGFRSGELIVTSEKPETITYKTS
jgi:hypothetical protein